VRYIRHVTEASSDPNGSDLSTVLGIGETYQQVLNDMGCHTRDDLLDLRAAHVTAQFRAKGLYISAAVVETWQLHASSYASGVPAVAPAHQPLPDFSHCIIFDLEYDPTCPHVWLTGVCVAHDDDLTYTCWWADSPEDEQLVLRQFAELVVSWPELPVVTWNGNCADIPQLRKAAERHNITDRLLPVFRRHFDLYSWAQRSVRLPIPNLSLKDTGEFLGHTRMSPVPDGLEALMMYGRYRYTGDHALRDQLIAYNHDDLAELVHVTRQLQRISDSSNIQPGQTEPAPTTGQLDI